MINTIENNERSLVKPPLVHQYREQGPQSCSHWKGLKPPLKLLQYSSFFVWLHEINHTYMEQRRVECGQKKMEENATMHSETSTCRLYAQGQQPIMCLDDTAFCEH